MLNNSSKIAVLLSSYVTDEIFSGICMKCSVLVLIIIFDLAYYLSGSSKPELQM